MLNLTLYGHVTRHDLLHATPCSTNTTHYHDGAP